MIWIYRILFLPLFLIAFPYYLKRMLKRGGYGKDLRQRFGSIPVLGPKEGKKCRIWIQAVSVGELLAVEPIIDGLNARGDVEIVLTTTTSTGYTLARQKYQERTRLVAIFPFDFALFSMRAWKRIRPDIAITMESELWPEHAAQARWREVPLLILNARMSDRSFRRYKKARAFGKFMLRSTSQILAASEQDRHRFSEIAEGKPAVKLVGNIKCDVALEPVLTTDESLALKKECGFPEDAFVLLGSSTWPGEEEALLQAFRRLREIMPTASLLIVPRHAERREEIRRLLSTTEYRHQLRSDQHPAQPNDIYVADTTGELRRFTQIADLAFVGKSLPPHTEGQTPIEAAGYGIPVLFGSGMSNFRAISRSLLEAQVALSVVDEKDLVEEVLLLAQDTQKRAIMTEAGKRWHKANRGALRRTLEILDDVIAEQREEKHQT